MFVEMMANGMRFSMFSRAKPTLPLPIVPNRELQVGLTVLALSLALSRGEREQITEVMFADKDGEWYEGFLFSRAKPFWNAVIPIFKKPPFQNGYRQKRWSGMNVRPCYLISEV